MGAGAGLASSAFFLPLALGRVAAGAGAGAGAGAEETDLGTAVPPPRPPLVGFKKLRRRWCRFPCPPGLWVWFGFEPEFGLIELLTMC